MTAMMENMISSALMRYAFFERALHSQGAWTMEHQGVSVPAERVFHDLSIEVVADFPAFCHLDAEPSRLFTICEDGEPVRTFVIDLPLPESGGEVALEVALPDPVAA